MVMFTFFRGKFFMLATTWFSGTCQLNNDVTNAHIHANSNKTVVAKIRLMKTHRIYGTRKCLMSLKCRVLELYD